MRVDVRGERHECNCPGVDVRRGGGGGVIGGGGNVCYVCLIYVCLLCNVCHIVSYCMYVLYALLWLMYMYVLRNTCYLFPPIQILHHKLIFHFDMYPHKIPSNIIQIYTRVNDIPDIAITPCHVIDLTRGLVTDFLANNFREAQRIARCGQAKITTSV